MAISEENIKFLSVSNYGKCKTYFPWNFHIPDQIEKQDFQEVKQSRKKKEFMVIWFFLGLPESTLVLNLDEINQIDSTPKLQKNLL